MSDTCPLLRLPAEIRQTIIRQSFACLEHVRVRSPSHRRLRPARIAKNDPQGILSTCHTLREESIPIFYPTTPVVFHCSNDAIEYLEDDKIDPFVKDNLVHLAVDDGDLQCMDGLLEKHMSLVDKAFNVCKALKALEFRVYACDSRPPAFASARGLVEKWKALKLGCNSKAKNASTNNSRKRAKLSDDDRISVVTEHIAAAGRSVNVQDTTAMYCSTNPRVYGTTTTLTCCNMVIGRDEIVKPFLGDAEQAVQRRKTCVGTVTPNPCAFDTDTRCPDAWERFPCKDLEESLRAARESAGWSSLSRPSRATVSTSA
jgi:hypothetical protein